MTLFRSLVAWLVLAAAGLPAVEAHVTASLVAAESSIQPGRAFTVALRLQHEDKWHTYWVNPGTGLATEIEWQLPDGFSAGPIRWPAPKIIKDHTGAITGNGFEGEALLLVTVTPPASLPPGSPVELKAKVDWLMCADVCIPGNADVALTLPVSAEPPAADPAWSAKIEAAEAALPRALPEWKVRAGREGANVRLALAPVGDAKHTPRDLRFFADDNYVAYDLPQQVAPAANGGFVVIAPVSPEAPAETKVLRGVLTSENGWNADGSLRGLRVEAALDAASGA
ncbi:MAG TPA: protein-disulfide reductase DsbD domain-containing protein, partial [Opitutus sp.]|nr:protein-disulfide reductase DsbD domain-containing protein [Opitutus sp.]